MGNSKDRARTFRTGVVTPPRIGRSIAACIRSGILVAISLGMMLLSPGAQQFAIAQAQPDPYREALAGLAEVMDRLEELQGAIDHSEFDVEALSLELAFEDAATIASWVRDNIAFEAYQGLLRGAEGTLLSRAGNSLDQALLLATLLRNVGFDARIARGTLGDDDARALVRGMRPAPDSELDPEIAQGLRDIGRELAELAGDSSTATPLDPAALTETSTELAAILRQRLAAGGIVLGGDDVEARLIAEAGDYFWVEYREGGGDWLEAHPAFTDSEPAATPAIGELLEDTVPEALQHRLRVEVTIEQRIGSRLERTTLVDWESPVANLVGRPITYGNAPLNVATWETIEDFGAALQENPIYAPIFDGSHAGGKVFDVNGTVIPLDAATNQASGVFQQVGEGFEEAGGALGGLDTSAADGSSDDILALTGQWIEYTLIAPDGSEHIERRTILDRIGAARRAAGEVAVPIDPDAFAPLTMAQTFMVGTGRYPGNYVAAQMIDALLASRPHYEELVRQAYDPRFDVPLPTDHTNAFGALEPLVLLSAFDAVPVEDASVLLYRPAPTLVVRQTDLAYSEGVLLGRELVDIVHNTRRGYYTDGEIVTAAPTEVLFAGVWETVVEDAFLSQIVTRSGERSNMALLTQQLQQAGIPFELLGPEDADDLAGLELPAEALEHLENDLRAGYSVLLPNRPLQDGAAVGWWRIDPRTGTTLGIGSDGRGQAIVAFVIILMNIAVGGLIVLALLMSECTRLIGPRGLRSKEEYATLRWQCALGGSYGQAATTIETDVLLRGDP